MKALKIAGGEHVLCNENVMKVKWAELYENLVIDENVPKLATEAFEATCLIMKANDNQFGALKKNLAQSMNVGRDEYP